jgi:hypothetical protein
MATETTRQRRHAQQQSHAKAQIRIAVALSIGLFLTAGPLILAHVRPYALVAHSPRYRQAIAVVRGEIVWLRGDYESWVMFNMANKIPKPDYSPPMQNPETSDGSLGHIFWPESESVVSAEVYGLAEYCQTIPSQHWFLGTLKRRSMNVPGYPLEIYRVPLFPALLLLGMAPALFIVQPLLLLWTQGRRRKLGLCQCCGYDLRVHYQLRIPNCPECGADLKDRRGGVDERAIQ